MIFITEELKILKDKLNEIDFLIVKEKMNNRNNQESKKIKKLEAEKEKLRKQIRSYIFNETREEIENEKYKRR